MREATPLRSRLGALCAILVLPLGACTSSQRGASASLDVPRASRGILLSLENRHATDVRVFLVRGPLRVRIAYLTTMERRGVELSPELVGTGNVIRLEVVPLGSRVGYLSDWIQAARGDHVTWTIEHRLSLSHHAVHSSPGPRP